MHRPCRADAVRLHHDDAAASKRDVDDNSKNTTLPVAREIAETYAAAPFKAPWYIDLLSINLNNEDLAEARQRIGQYMDASGRDGAASHRTWSSRREKLGGAGSGRSQS